MTLSGAESEALSVAAGAGLAAAIAWVLSLHAPAPRACRRPALWLGAMIALFFAAYAALAVLKFRAYNMGAEDLGRVDQAIWSVLEGRPLVFSATELGRPMSRMAGHVELLYVALAPLYWLWDSAEALLVAQAALAALGALPAYRIGRRLSGPNLGLATALAYLAHPGTGHALLAEVHGDTLAMPLLLFTLDFALAGRRRLAFGFLVLALLGKEYVAALAVTLGLFLLTRRDDRRLGAAAIALGLVWVLLVIPLIHAQLRPAGFPDQTSVHFRSLGSTPQEVALTALSRPWLVLREVLTPRKLGVLALLLAPLAYLPLGSPIKLLLAAPVLLPLAFTEQLDLRNHHHATILPFLVLGAAEGAYRLGAAHGHRLLLAATAVVHVTMAPSPFSLASWTPGRWDYLLNPHRIGRNEHHRFVERALALVPRGARVSVSSHLVPQLSHRPTCFDFPAPGRFDDIDWVVVDLLGGYPPAYRPRAAVFEALAPLLSGTAFKLVYRLDGVLVLGRAAAAEEPAARRGVRDGRYAVGPLLLTVREGTASWTSAHRPSEPLLVLDSATRELVWSLPELLPGPYAPPAGSRLLVLAPQPGFPGFDPRDPPQPWLPDPYRGERLLP